MNAYISSAKEGVLHLAYSVASQGQSVGTAIKSKAGALVTKIASLDLASFAGALKNRKLKYGGIALGTGICLVALYRSGLLGKIGTLAKSNKSKAEPGPSKTAALEVASETELTLEQQVRAAVDAKISKCIMGVSSVQFVLSRTEDGSFVAGTPGGAKKIADIVIPAEKGATARFLQFSRGVDAEVMAAVNQALL